MKSLSRVKTMSFNENPLTSIKWLNSHYLTKFQHCNMITIIYFRSTRTGHEKRIITIGNMNLTTIRSHAKLERKRRVLLCAR